MGGKFVDVVIEIPAVVIVDNGVEAASIEATRDEVVVVSTKDDGMLKSLSNEPPGTGKDLEDDDDLRVSSFVGGAGMVL